MILPNSANQCAACLAQQFNLKDLVLPKGDDRIDIHQCRRCRRFARTETRYEYCEMESPQLLSICLKHIPSLVHTPSAGSAKLHIVDAIWVWTEPHSMRLKVRVTIRTELENIQLQQRVMVEFQIRWRQCPDCNREFTSRTWAAIVQLRQKRDAGKKGLAALEMALKKNDQDIRKHVLQIDSSRYGLDFYFLTLAQAQHFAGFLQRLAPLKIKTSQKLVSTDNHSNTAHIKHTVTADMVPLCRDDLILVGKGSRTPLAGRLGLVLKVTSNISVVDASPQRTPRVETTDLSAETYYKAGGDKTFPILQTAERMIRWVVLDVELMDENDDNNLHEGSKTKGVSKYAMANALVARESDMGKNDMTYDCVTHLGHLIQPGDTVLGYDLESTSASLSTSSELGVVDLEEVLHSNVVLPDVVLVKKVPPSKNGDVDAGNNADDDEPVREGKKRVSKKKLRRRRKQDKKQRELEETAVRMGFLDDGQDGDDDDEAMDEDMAADLEAVERELATYQAEQPEEPAGEEEAPAEEDP